MKLKTQQFLEDIFYVKDDSVRDKLSGIINITNQITDEIQTEIPSKEMTDLEGVKELKSKVEEFNRIPTMVDYNGGVYLVRVLYRNLSVKFKENGKGNIDILYLEMDRIIGIDNDMEKDKVIKQGHIHWSNKGNVSIILNAWVNTQPTDKMFMGRGLDFTPGIFRGTDPDYHKITVGDMLLNYSNQRGFIQYPGDFYWENKGAYQNIIKNEYTDLAYKEQPQSVSNEGNYIINDKVDIIPVTFRENMDLIRELTQLKGKDNKDMLYGFKDKRGVEGVNFYTHTIYNKYKTEVDILKVITKSNNYKAGPFTRFTTPKGAVTLNKQYLNQLVNESSENKEFIEDYLKNSVLYAFKDGIYGAYTFNETDGKFKAFGYTETVYVGGINFKSLYGIAQKTQFDSKTRFDVSNVVTNNNQVIEMVDGEEEREYEQVRTIPFKTIFVYNNGKKVRDKIGVSPNGIKTLGYGGVHDLQIEYIVNNDSIHAFLYSRSSSIESHGGYQTISCHGRILESNTNKDNLYNGISMGLYNRLSIGMVDGDGRPQSFNEDNYLRRTGEVDYDKGINRLTKRGLKGRVSVGMEPVNDIGMWEFAQSIDESTIFNIYQDIDLTDNDIFKEQ